MSGTDSSQGGLTRRGFLKTTGVAAGALATAGIASQLSGLSPDRALAAESGEDSGSARKKIPTTCMGNCHGFACPRPGGGYFGCVHGGVVVLGRLERAACGGCTCRVLVGREGPGGAVGARPCCQAAKGERL